MKDVKAYAIKDTRIKTHVYDGQPSTIMTETAYILVDRHRDLPIGKSVRTLFSIDKYFNLKSGRTVKIPANLMASIDEISLENFQRIFELAGGSVETETGSNSQF